MQPARADIVLRRNVPFIEEWSFVDDQGQPFDFTGWTGKLEVRQYGAAPGDAQITLTTDTGLQNVYFFPDDRSTLRIGIDAPAVNALPPAPEAGGTATLIYDLVLTDPTGLKQVFREGSAIVLPGVTR